MIRREKCNITLLKMSDSFHFINTCLMDCYFLSYCLDMIEYMRKQLVLGMLNLSYKCFILCVLFLDNLLLYIEGIFSGSVQKTHFRKMSIISFSRI